MDTALAQKGSLAFLSIFYLFVWVCICVSVHTHHEIHMTSENNLWNLAYFFYRVDARDGTGVVRLGGKHGVCIAMVSTLSFN